MLFCVLLSIIQADIKLIYGSLHNEMGNCRCVMSVGAMFVTSDVCGSDVCGSDVCDE